MFFKDFRKFETTLAGRPLVVETGKMAQLAGGSCLIRYGETEVLCTATMADKPREGVDFFPLSVDFEEKLYSVGRIPGSFQRREGKASEKATLASRVIDRPIRPLFPKDMRNDVGVVATVMSVDPDCSPEITAMIGVSVAISISAIPWDGPISGVSVGLIDGEYVINPTEEQRKVSQMAVTVASTKDLVAMIEAGANEVSNEDMFDGIMYAHKVNQEIVKFIEDIRAEVGKEKIDFPSNDPSPEMFEAIKEFAIDDVKVALDTDDKRIRDEALRPIYAAVHEKFDEVYPDDIAKIDDCMYKLQKFIVRRWLLDEGKRVDGRGIDEIRPLNAEIDLLSRVHGSGMFTRGQTQCLSITTLGPMSDVQMLDGIDNETEKRYIHHYNFPSYSVGETRPSRGPGRREIGHGALAERALLPVIPSVEEFPYCIRVVSEVLSSNGSTSQGSICGSTLSLMAAGVPIKAPVAGISCGLITEGDRFMTMVDIQGLEDFFGDMDFKVAGTRDFITALQLDTKLDGIDSQVLRAALAQARDARLAILDLINQAIDGPDEMSPNAPRIITVKVPVDKIGEVIGPKGKMINQIQDETGASVDIQEDGTVFVGGTGESVDQAVERIKLIIKVPEPGEEYTGRVVSIQPFGAFVNLLPGKDGLLHISRVAKGRVEKVEDVLNVGDEVKVVVIEVDDRGKISLDRLDKPEAPARAEGASEGDGEHFQRRERPRRERSERSDRPRRPGDNGGRKPRRHHDAE